MKRKSYYEQSRIGCFKRKLPKTLFTAQAQAIGIHQIAEVFPTSWYFKAFLILFGCHKINGRCGWHRSGESGYTVLFEVWNTFEVVSNDLKQFNEIKLVKIPIQKKFFEILTANESLGVTKNAFRPMIMLRSPSPSNAAPMS